MGRVNDRQAALIEKYIREQGISFSPLREELFDHLLSDIEQRMEDGASFESAWQSVTGQIAKNHLKQIESETMEILNKKVNLNKLFAAISIGLLALATFFKTMHWPGADKMLLSFFLLASLLLFISMIRSNISHRELKGRVFLTIISLGLIAFLSFLTFKILHLPGANFLGGAAVIILGITLPAVSLYFINKRGNLRDYVILQVLERNGQLLERIALAMVAFGLLFNIVFWTFGEPQFIGVIFFLLTIVWIGIYAYSLTWRQYVEHPDAPVNRWLFILSTFSLILFLFPLISNFFFSMDAQFMHNQVRSIVIYLSPVLYIGIIMYHYLKRSQRAIVLTCGLFLIYFSIQLAANLNLFPAAETLMLSKGFYLAWLVFLLGLLIAFRNEMYYRVLLIFMIAAHMIPLV